MLSPRTTISRSLRAAIPAIALGIAAAPLSAQGGRGAGTTLLATATVMPPAVQSFSVTSISAPAVRRPRPTSMEVTSSIDVVGSAPYRVVLRLADAAAGGAIRVWVRTHRGTFERLDESRPVTVASSYAAADSHRRTDLVFRVEADDPRTLDALAIPVACEVVAQADDAVSAYRFTAVLGASRGERPR